MSIESVYSFQQVLDSERREILERREQVGLPPDESDASLTGVPTKTAGLALSGGGVRSACIGLGLLQSLYRSGVLRHIDYLSTVSGGGYVGSYLSSWLAAVNGKVDWRSEKDRICKQEDRRSSKANGRAIIADGTPLPFYARRNAPQPESVNRMANMGEVLRKPVKFLSRHLWGLLIVNGFVLSIVVALGTLAALVMRIMDLPAVSPFLAELGFFGDMRRAFFPAALAFAVWLFTFALSNRYRQKRIQAPPFSTWAYAALIVAIALGAVSLLASGNLDTDTLQVRQGAGTELGDRIRSVAQWAGRGLLILLGAALAPFLTLRSLIRSGTAPRWRMESWVFNLVAYAAIGGVPLLVYAWAAQENISQYNSSRQNAGEMCRNHIRDWREWSQLFGSVRPTDPRPSVIRSLRSWANELGRTFGKAEGSSSSSPLQQTVGTFSAVSEPPGHPNGVRESEHLVDAIRGWLADTNLDDDKPAEKSSTRQPLATAISPTVDSPLERVLLLQRQMDYTVRSRWLPTYWVYALGGMFLVDDTFEQELRNGARLNRWKDRLTDEFNREVLSNPYLYLYIQNSELRADSKDAPGRLKIPELQDLGYYRDRAERLEKRANELLSKLNLAKPPQTGISGFVSSFWGPPSLRIEKLHPQWDVLLQLEKERQRSREMNRRQFRDRAEGETANGQNALAKQGNDHDEVHDLLQEIQTNNWCLVRRYLANKYDQDYLYAPSEVFALVVTAEDEYYRLYVFGWSVLAAVFWGMLFSVNPTLLHSYYRDQLAEQWIEPHPKFDRQLPLAALQNCQKGGPLHLLTGTQTFFGRLRAPQSDATGRFTFSRGHIGSSRTGFTRTEKYCRGGCELADAMAVSGAAVSLTALDNVLVRMLLLLTNFRLGQWMPNPSNLPNDLARPTPLRLLLDYVIHRPEDRRYLFVADGGYVDNTGITPLLQRRCRVIIACDAGQDGAFEFADLRRVMAEGESRYGVQFSATDSDDPIPFESITMPLPEGGKGGALRTISKNYYLIIKITYPDDEATRQANLGPDRTGYLVYVKPTLTGKEPADLLHYRHSQPEFPHDPTVEQFFSPLQFHMYRRLGERLGDVISRECFDAISDSEPLWRWDPKPANDKHTVRTSLGMTDLSDADLKKFLRDLNGPLDQRRIELAKKGLQSPSMAVRIGTCITVRENAERHDVSDEVRNAILQVFTTAFRWEKEQAVREEICKSIAVVGENDAFSARFLKEIADDPKADSFLRDLCRDLYHQISKRPAAGRRRTRRSRSASPS